MEMCGQPDAPAALPLVPTQPGQSGEEKSLLPLPGIEPQIVQPVAKAV
jgi:hypothetical protein